jgi:hypothetical protein
LRQGKERLRDDRLDFLSAPAVVDAALFAEGFSRREGVRISVYQESAGMKIGFSDVEVLECGWIEILMLAIE